MNISQRLTLLRQEMIKHGVDIYLVPSIDAHNSEYVPECWQRRPWISGFDGSAGEVMVTLEHAYLWTDGRYFLQAEQQLDAEHFSLMKQTGFVSESEQWLATHAQSKKLGFDPRLVGVTRAKNLTQIMSNVQGEAVVLEQNLIDQCKTQLGESLSIPQQPAFALGVEFSGESLAARLSWLRGELVVNASDYIALNVLDEIAWLFNIRGSDIEYNPLVISYALLSAETAVLFVDLAKISHELATHLKAAGVELLPYTEFGLRLAQIKGKVLLDERTASYWMYQSASKHGTIIFGRSPIVARKALKNSVEIAGSRHAHVKDAVAMVNFIYWLENNWQAGVDEISAADKLADFRAEQENLRGLSFATISGYASNGAIIHYRATPASNKVIRDDNLYLLDSGGQYLEGTTDITRTFHLGVPTAEQRKHYTLVLKGHLALARAIFSHGTCGEHLDAFARAPLWSQYLNYRHGTGHGVGSFLCVHEGPHKISPGVSGVALVPGMIVSNEPGFYVNGSHGVRIENLCLVNQVTDPRAKASEYGPFYSFEDLTLVPYCKRLIDLELLNSEELEQIRRYYRSITEQIVPRLAEAEREWLLDELAV